MSDSSSSDGEESRFREVCDPTLWRTAAEEGVENGNSTLQVADPQHNHHCHKPQEKRQSFLLLEKIRSSLASYHTRKAGRWMGCEGPDTNCIWPRRAEARMERVAAPSTLAPFLARQLAIWLDRNVESLSSQGHPQPVSSECARTDQQPFLLFKNLPLLPQGGEIPSYTQKIRRRKIPKRLSYFDSSDEEEVMTRCRSVAVTPERILARDESYPHPHPKNVRYIEEFRVEETRPDGSIIAVPCSASGNTATATSSKKDEARKVKVRGSQSGKEESASLTQEKVCGFQNGGAIEERGSALKKPRKQLRKRGKKKKIKETVEVCAS